MPGSNSGYGCLLVIASEVAVSNAMEEDVVGNYLCTGPAWKAVVDRPGSCRVAQGVLW